MPGQRAPEEQRREQIVSAAYAVSLRTGIGGVTLRAVAAQAKLSHGLVIFYFRKKDQLVDALLDRLLATTVMAQRSSELSQIDPPHAFTALLREELGRLSRDPRSTRLLLEYWALGVRQQAIRRKIAAALERYRAAFRSMAEGILPTPAPGSTDPSPAALATVAVGLITGLLVQSMMDPKNVDMGAYMSAVDELIERLATGVS